MLSRRNRGIFDSDGKLTAKGKECDTSRIKENSLKRRAAYRTKKKTQERKFI